MTEENIVYYEVDDPDFVILVDKNFNTNFCCIWWANALKWMDQYELLFRADDCNNFNKTVLNFLMKNVSENAIEIILKLMKEFHEEVRSKQEANGKKDAQSDE